MQIQDLMFHVGATHEVVVADKHEDGTAYNRPIFRGTLDECREFIDDQTKGDEYR